VTSKVASSLSEKGREIYEKKGKKGRLDVKDIGQKVPNEIASL